MIEAAAISVAFTGVILVWVSILFVAKKHVVVVRSNSDIDDDLRRATEKLLEAVTQHDEAKYRELDADLAAILAKIKASK